MKNDLIYKLLDPQRFALLDIAHLYHEAGYRCLLVGGSVRDLCLGSVPADFDMATNAPVEVSQRLFKKVIPTGVKHGTVTVRHLGKSYEITRFRQDVDTDGRHAVVEFSETIEEDLNRRDLRINAMAYDLLVNQLIDPLGGCADIENRLVQFVGEAQKRITEDHLRALRYLRMIHKLKPFGFTYIETEWAAVKSTFDPKFLTIERVYDELSKMRSLGLGNEAVLVGQLNELKVFRAFVDPQAEVLALDWMFRSGNHTGLGVLAALHQGVSKPPSGLRLTKQESKQARLILTYWDEDLTNQVKLKSFLSQLPADARLPISQLYQGLRGTLIADETSRILEANEPLGPGDLCLSSKDLIQLGFQGPGLGRVQRELLSLVWSDPSLNEKMILLEQVKQRKKQDSQNE